MEYWYRGYKPLNLNFDLEKDQEDPTQEETDNFYDDTYDEDHDSAFSFWIKSLNVVLSLTLFYRIRCTLRNGFSLKWDEVLVI